MGLRGGTVSGYGRLEQRLPDLDVLAEVHDALHVFLVGGPLGAVDGYLARDVERVGGGLSKVPDLVHIGLPDLLAFLAVVDVQANN